MFCAAQGTDTNLSNTALKGTLTPEGSAGVMHHRTLVFVIHHHYVGTVLFYFIDYEWYSCLKRYDALFP